MSETEDKKSQDVIIQIAKLNEIASRINLTEDTLKAINNAQKQMDLFSSQLQNVTKESDVISSKKTQSEDNSKRILDLLETSKQKNSEIEAIAKRIGELKNEIEFSLKTIESERGKWNASLESTNKTHSDKLNTLYTTESQKFDELYKNNNSSYKDLFEKIEKLLPGATSAGLAKGFQDRKHDLLTSKKIWAFILIVSVIALIGFGIYSIVYLGQKDEFSFLLFSSRVLVIAGLVIAEEFARRNYNISSRLEEAYANKEIIAKSYDGFKKQMENINIRVNEKSEAQISAVSKLVTILLDKLEDEPGEKVFDKEPSKLGVAAFLDNINTPNKEIAPNLVHNDWSKFSWPAVVAIGIIALTFTFSLYVSQSQDNVKSEITPDSFTFSSMETKKNSGTEFSKNQKIDKTNANKVILESKEENLTK